MTLALPHVDQLPALSDRQRALAQWWTPPELARRLAEFALQGTRFPRVLDPAAGAGALLDAIFNERPMAQVTAVEVDPRWAAELRQQRLARGWTNDVVEADYLTTPMADYDVVVMNPPYEGGRDAEFLERAMLHAPRIAALLRVNALTGLYRHERVWSRIGIDWQMTGLAYCARRPQFLAAGVAVGSAESDFCAVRLERGKRRRKTHVEWWT